ncbi:MAG TPA: alanine racemase, partial [Chitinophagaceae bacterium]|nr:alanine racemase [Chitinophagaceae bacterium]
QFPDIKFYSLVDNKDSLYILQKLFGAEGLTANVYIDVDVGMHRTGIPVNKDFFDFYETVMRASYVNCRGLHVYDGHIHIRDFKERKKKIAAGYQQIEQVIQKIKALDYAPPHVIAGGSPSFTVHALNPEVDCSPGTCLLWDKGYADMLPEQNFLHAAVLLTRVISKPVEGILTTDLGHKSLAPENPIRNRISFLNLTDYEVASQSEEHMVVKVSEREWKQWKVGDILYGIPFHICPTVASYDEVQVIKNGEFTELWQVAARKRKIKI